MSHPIQLIVGLGNPGAEYADTRHNAGAWLVESLAEQQNVTLRKETKFSGKTATINFDDHECRLLLPTTYMNDSGKSVKALASFYRIPPEAILVVHDELDLPVGVARLKQGGGAGGHNGLKDITAHLNTQNYWRLRIGIAHPGDRAQVLDFVLGKPSRADHEKIMQAIENSFAALAEFVNGHRNKAIQILHTN